jgi:hypothetical protein
MDSFDLTQLLGVYFLIVGLIVVVRRTAIMPTISELVKNRALVLVMGLIELFAGLAIILVYSDISFTPDGVISLVGWMMVVESVFYLLLPAREMQKFIRSFNTPTWYLAGGLFAILIGAYLTSVGFHLVS